MNTFNKLLSRFFILLFLFCGSCFAQTALEKDPFLQALKSELDRSYQTLKERTPLLSHLSYRVVEEENYQMSAGSGVLLNSNHHPNRMLEIGMSMGENNRVLLFFTAIPMNEDETFSTLKDILWRETEKAYQATFSDYLLRYNLKFPAIPDNPNDYTNRYEEAQSIAFDQSLWEGRIKRISAPFADEKSVFEDVVSLRYSPQRIYYLFKDDGNTESFYQVENIQVNSCSIAFELTGIWQDKLVKLPKKQLIANFPEELPEEYILIDSSKALIHQLLTDNEKKETLYFLTVPILDRPVGADMVGNKEIFKDLAFNAMQEEIDININNLQQGDAPPPYFIAYTITDAQYSRIETSLGATVFALQEPIKQLITKVLVGDDKASNQHYEDSGEERDTPDRIAYLSQENSYRNIREILWKSTDYAYKTALCNYERKNIIQSQQKREELLPTLPDRVSPTPIEHRQTGETSQIIEQQNLG
ncbi:MAG: hypothetical protein LBV46_03450, partial [Bacteroidales bacterium]|nr:hypothetical protein [Bacteroidales bacterium]